MGRKAALQAGELNWQETRFVENYISNGGNATQAYISAGYSRKSARQNASLLLSKQCILDAIEIERAQFQSIIDFKREDALRILVAIAKARASDFAGVDCDDRESFKDLGYLEYAIESIEPTKLGTKLKLHNRVEALNELWTKLGLGETSGKGNWFDGLDELMQLVRATKKK